MVASFFSGEIFGFVYTKTITHNLTPSYSVYPQNGVNVISANNNPAYAVSYTNS